MNQLEQILLKVAAADTDVLSKMQKINSIRIESWLPLWLIPFLIAGAFILAFALYRRERAMKLWRRLLLSILRGSVYALIVLLIAAPELRINGEGIMPGRIPIVVDGSLSMSITDAPEERMRYDYAKALAEKIRRSADGKNDLSVQVFAAGKNFRLLNTEDLESGAASGAEAASHGDSAVLPPSSGGRGGADLPDQDYTSFAEMLEQALASTAGEFCPGIILLSDGANNSEGKLNTLLRQFKKKRIPVCTLGVGSSAFRDISIHAVYMDTLLFLNEKCKAQILLTDNGCSNEKVQISARVGDVVVYSGEHALQEGGETLIPIEFTPVKTGVFELQIEVKALPGEATLENNVYLRNFRVIDQQLRVLLVFSQPSWEYRYLAGTFLKDKRIDVKSYLMDIDGRRSGVKIKNESEFIKELPKSKEELSRQYDVVLLSGIDMTLVEKDFIEALRKYVDEAAGGLVLLSDPVYIPYTLRGSSLEDLVPMSIPKNFGRSYSDETSRPLLEPLHFMMTEEGENSALLQFSPNKKENKLLWDKMPPIYSIYSAGRAKPAALTILASFRNERRQSYPAILSSSYGRGTVLFLAFDSTWRWRKEFGNRFFGDFWGKVIPYLGLPHLLNEAQQSSIFVSDENCAIGEKLQISAKVFDAAFKPVNDDRIPIRIRHSADGSAEAREYQMTKVLARDGMYRLEYIPEQSGELVLSLSEKHAAQPVSVRILKPNREFRNCGLNTESLQKLSGASNGKMFAEKELSTVIDFLLSSRRNETLERSKTLWDTWPMLSLLLLFLAAEWITRKLCCLD